MRRFFTHFILALCAWAAVASTASAASWDDIYKARLNASATYLEAKLALKTAELAYDSYIKVYIPRLSFSTSTSTALNIGGGGVTSGALIPSLTLENLLGANLSLKAPLVASSTGALTFDDPSLSLTRKLFVETAADRLDAEAAILSAQAAVRNAEKAMRLSLATDILNAKYYESLLEENKKNLTTLEKVKTATKDTIAIRELDKRILQAKKAILVATNALADIDDDVKGNVDALNGDVLRMQNEWTRSIDTSEPTSSLEIRALERSLEAAQRRQGFSFLPYLPNPSITASLSYNLDKSRIDWGLSFTLSYDALDKGERALSAYKREEYPTIIALKLQDTRKNLTDGIRKIRENLELLQLDRQIQNLTIADASDNADLMERLYHGGFVSEENYVIAQIDLAVENINGQKIDFDILLQKLNLASYYDSGQ